MELSDTVKAQVTQRLMHEKPPARLWWLNIHTPDARIEWSIGAGLHRLPAPGQTNDGAVEMIPQATLRWRFDSGLSGKSAHPFGRR